MEIDRSIFDSSVMEEPITTRYVFMCMALIAERKHGIVDMTVESLSRKINCPKSALERAIAALMAPDPNSRTQEHEGRRLLQLDPNRNWGWVVVNRPKYAVKARRQLKLERDRAYQRRRRAGIKQPDKNVTTRDDGKRRESSVSPLHTSPLRGEDKSSLLRLSGSQRDMKAIGDVIQRSGQALKGRQFGAWARRLRLYREAGFDVEDLVRDLESCARAGYIGTRGNAYLLKVIDGLVENGRCGKGVVEGRRGRQDPGASSETVRRAEVLDEEPEDS